MKRKVDLQREQLVDEAGPESAEAAATVMPESGRGLTVNTARHNFVEDYVHATNPEKARRWFWAGRGVAVAQVGAQAEAKPTAAVLAGLNLLGEGEPPEPEDKPRERPLRRASTPPLPFWRQRSTLK